MKIIPHFHLIARRAALAVPVAACVLCSGCFSIMSGLGRAWGTNNGMDPGTALMLDIITSPIQIAALAGYLLYETAEPVVEGVVGGAVNLVYPPSAQEARYVRKNALVRIRSTPSCVAEPAFLSLGEDGRPTPQTLAFAEALRDPDIRFPSEVLDGAIERLRAVPKAIPAFASIFARPELDAATLERLRPTVEEWSRDWSRDCERAFRRNPNLAARDAPPPEPAATKDTLLAALRADPTLVLKDSVFWSSSGPDARAALAALLADESADIPDRVLVFLGTILFSAQPDSAELLRMDDAGHLADPATLRRALAVELARRSAILDAEP